jgi:tRNA modification GTPase
MEQADLVLAVIDISRLWDETDLSLISGLDPARSVVVCNKTDLVADSEKRVEAVAHDLAGVQPAGTGAPGWEVCAVSAATGDGLDDLRGLIERIISGGEGLHLEEPVLATERQRGLVGEAFGRTEAALAATARETDEELVCEDIREAIQALGRITGEDLTQDLLDEIFTRFCLGK